MRKKGFTLIELLAVIAILAILVIVAMPNVMSMFNKAKQSSFENGVKSHIKTLNTKFFTTGELKYSNKVEGAEKLDMDGEEFDYYIELDTRGNIKTLNITNGEYKIEATGTTANPVKLEQIGSLIKTEVVKTGELFVMDGNGNINSGATENSTQVVSNLNITLDRKDLFTFDRVVVSYDSSKQTPEQFYNSTLESTGDMDADYYKIDNNKPSIRTQFYIDMSIDGNVQSSFLYRMLLDENNEEVAYYVIKNGEESFWPFLISTDGHSSSGYNYSTNFTKGLWFVNLLNIIKFSDYLIIKEGTFTGKTKFIDGNEFIKVSNDVITVENLIGKQLLATGNGFNESLSDNITITESLINVVDSNIMIANVIAVVPNDGIYVELSRIIDLLDITIKTY